MIDSKDIYQQNENTVTRNVAGETLIVPISGKLANLERVFTLNEVGAFIWNSIDGKTDVKSILLGLIEEFDIDQETAQTDLTELINDLNSSRLVIKTG